MRQGGRRSAGLQRFFDGEERWKKITLLNPFSLQSSARQIVGIIEDVTEERKKEHQLLKEKALIWRQ